MLIDTTLWLYILGVLALIIFLLTIKNLAKVKVWINQKGKPGSPFITTSYLKLDADGSAGEVHIIGGDSSTPAIGRVIVEKQAGKEHGFVQVVTTDISDETQSPSYKQMGFLCFHEDSVIDKYGYIYAQKRGQRKEIIGYCARPSAPNVPTIYGERNWRSLWLKCTLNAYLGTPGLIQDSTQEKSTEKTDKLIRIHAKKESTNNNLSCNEVSSNDVEDLGSTNEGLNLNEDNTELPTEETTALEGITPTDELLPQEPLELEDTSETSEVEDTDVEISQEEVKEEEQNEEDTSESLETTDTSDATEATTEEQDTELENTSEGDKGTENSDIEDAECKEEENKGDEKAENSEENVVPNNKDTKKKEAVKEAFASVHFWGFHSSAKDYLPAEARACAYALLSGGKKKRKYSEYYKEKPYGWKDTALLTTLIYCVFFLVIYTINTGILKMPLLGDDILAVAILIVGYFLLWAIVRLIKIDCIESSNSFQKKLDLLNKNLSLTGFNYSIIILGIVAIYFCYSHYDFDFIPLIVAIISGVSINMLLNGANAKWTISTTYNETNDEDEEDEEIKNPPGDISRNYEWDLDKTYSTQQLHGSLTLYFTAKEIADLRQCNPFFTQRKDKSDKEYIVDMFNFLTEHKKFKARVKFIAKYINDTINQNNLTPIDKIQFTLDFIQEPNISFVKNKECRTINFYENYIRYPDETLYDKEGDSNSKTLLAAVLFHTMGFNVMYLASHKHEHAAIGIEIPKSKLDDGWFGSDIKNNIFTENGKSYIFCETTGDSFKIGSTINGMSLNDFDEKVLIEVEGEEQLEEEETQSTIYNWELRSYYGNTLHGNITVKFNKGDIDNLREMNPFCNYGYDSNTYEGNVTNMFNTLRKEPTLNANVEQVASYIKSEIAKSNYPELDLIQFTLSFAQAPNITYRIDEECASIGFAKEYMRYPSETMFDKEGDCDCKSFLAANILHHLGYNVIFMISQKLKHAAIAVECKDEWFDKIGRENVDNIVLEHNGRKYVYCESTGEGNMVGHINEGDSIKDFEKIVELSI